jgi:hypothetical protein
MPQPSRRPAPSRADIIGARAGVLLIAVIWVGICLVVLTIVGLITDFAPWTEGIALIGYSLISVRFIVQARRMRKGIQRWSRV